MKTARARMPRSRRAALAAGVLAAVGLLVALLAPAVAAAAGTATYSATETIPVPPASAYAGSGGGDGWAVSLSSSAVYNVFHHSSSLTIACHQQADASACWAPETITDTGGSGFSTSGHPGLWLDQSAGKLYAFATRDDGAAGVVCIDTTTAASNPNPFCGFTALTAADPAAPTGTGGLSEPALVGSRWYAFNYVPGTPASGTENTMLCFDVSTKSACAAQPFPVTFGVGSFGGSVFPEPQMAAIGGRVIVAASAAPGGQISCFDPATNRTCTGAWPVSAPSYPSQFGAPFPRLSSTGAVTGFCLPDGTDECFDLTGAALTTPAGLAAAIPATSGWNGQAVVLGPRVYVADGNSNAVDCYDANTAAACANFPKTLASLGLLYTVNVDPRRPTCLWVNADNGSSQVQNFDAYTGGACGQGPIRVLASSFVVPTQLCQPATYTALQVTSPAPGTYGSGSVSFQDGDATAIAGAPDKPLDGTGAVSLTGLNLTTAVGLPQFLITLTGAQGTPGAVTVKLTWTGTDDPTCVPPGGSTTGGSGSEQCGNTVFLFAMGSGQYYKSSTDLSPSPQLAYLLKAARSTARGKTIGVRVLDYPATSVDALFAGIKDIKARNRLDWLNRANKKLTANTDSYLAGEKKGLAAMWGEYTSVRFGCPSSTKIIVAGYSQGAMVVHEFLNELAATSDTGGKRAVIGAALIADPERVKWSEPVEFSDAAGSSYGVCELLNARVHCAAPDRLADISPTFRSKTVSVCSYFDPVCDTSQMLSDGIWSVTDEKARASAIRLAEMTHDSYRYMPATKTAGKWLGQKVARS